MLQTAYNFGIALYEGAIRIAALKSQKARLWLDGRKNWKNELKEIAAIQGPKLLVHAASLGEMEQGQPILEKLRFAFPKHTIVVSFFSPSGYLNFKPEGLCDKIIYLPSDKPKNASFFAHTLRPEISLFIKYEIWPNLLKELESAQSKLYLAPAEFRPNQIYFKPIIGGFFRKALQRFNHIHVQTQGSLQLLTKWGFKAVSLVGDSRFDRAMQVRNQEFKAVDLSNFCANQTTLIVGSSWTKEETLTHKLLSTYPEFKLILAPHDVSAENINRILQLFKDFKISRYSSKKIEPSSRVLLIDGIGQLKYLYRFADLALIGGGFGKGVHSTVEAAVYKIPIAFGPKHQKFPETIELMEQGFARSIDGFADLNDFFLRSQNLPINFEERYTSFLDRKTGAAHKIAEAIKHNMLNA